MSILAANMPVYLLNEDLEFPDPELAQPDGLLAIGGDLNPGRLLLAYEKGIFPWYNPADPILWWSPDPRGVIIPSQIKVSNSMRNVLNREDYTLSFDKNFPEVIRNCRIQKRNENGTWISDDISKAYTQLHEIGLAHSVEVWRDKKLVGGLYGVSIGNAFFGESMFSAEKNCSKIALIHLSRVLEKLNFSMIDCQLYTQHLGTLGAVEMSRTEFLAKLKSSLKNDSIVGNWGQNPNFQ